MLAKSLEKRDERAKAMLKDYMKRNYKVRLCDQICCTLDAATYLSADFFKQK